MPTCKLLLASILLSAAIGTAAPTFTLIGPTGVLGQSDINVPIGGTSGWGIQIYNDSTTDWMASSSSQFCPVSSCNPADWSFQIGSYSDYWGSANFYVIAPQTTFTAYFDDLTMQGAGVFTTNPAVPNGLSQVGRLLFTYDRYDGDPNLPSSNQVGFSDLAVVHASVTAGSSVPEPATGLGIGIALALAAVLRRRTRMA